MNKDQWRQIEKIFYSAMELPLNERDEFVGQACAGDEELGQEVLALLAANRDAMSFLDSPVAMPTHSGTLSPTRVMPQVISNSNSAESGIRVGHYRLLREIGRGGMGVVYEAEQEHPRRPVALKVIRGGRLVDEYQVKLFRREAQALARLKHPGIAAIYEAGCADDGQHYFVMELVRGIPLLDYVKGRRLTCAQASSNIRQRLELFLKICEAISYAHQRGVIHRDLKPANILVADESEGQNLDGPSMSRVEVKVLDFGLARITDEDGAGASGMSQAGEVRGTLPYMSPEQVGGDPDQIDVRADVYTLGVILYEMLTERFPYDFERAALPQAIRIICEEAPKPPSRMWSELRDRESGKTERIDRDVETIVLKALEKEPERRYQSAAALAEDVTRYLTNQPIQARPPNALYQFRKLVARHKAPFAMLAAVFALLLGFAITMAMQSARIARERDKAVAAERVAAEQRLLAEANLKIAEEQRALAEEQRKVAERQRTEAKTQRDRAVWQEQANRRLLYAAHMNLAQQAWESADVGRVEELLESLRPHPGDEDLRGFEWYYLWRLSHRFSSAIRHNGAIYSVAFSPDWKRLATGSGDGTVKLWDAATGQETRSLKGHLGIVNSVAFSPDGKRLATGSLDRTVKLWDVATGQETLTLRGHSDIVWAVTFSPDGKRLATGSGDRTVKLWDAGAGRESITFKRQSSSVHSVAFSPDGKRLATGSNDGTVTLWDVGAGQETFSLKGHSSWVKSVAFSPDGKRLATGSGDRTVTLWDATTGQETLSLKGHLDDVLSVAFSPDGKRLTTGSRDRTVKLWDAATGQETLTLKGHSSSVLSVAFSPDGKRLATGSFDGTIKLWDAANSQGTLTLRGHSGTVRSGAFSPDGKRLVTGSGDGTVRLWDAASGQEVFTLKGHSSDVLSVTFSPDGKRLATGSGDRTVKLWDAATGRELITFKRHSSAVHSVAFSPDGKRLATGSVDGTVKLLDAASGQEVFTLKGHSDWVRSVAFSPDGKRLAAGSFDGTVRLLDAATGQETLTLRGHSRSVNSVAFSPDGKRLATGSLDHIVKLWDAATGQATLISQRAFEICQFGGLLARREAAGDREL